MAEEILSAPGRSNFIQPSAPLEVYNPSTRCRGALGIRRLNKVHIFGLSAVLLILAVGLGLNYSIIAFLVFGLPAFALFVLGIARKPDPLMPAEPRRKRRRSLLDLVPAPPEPEKRDAPVPVQQPHAVQGPLLRVANQPTSYFVGVGQTVNVGWCTLQDPLIYVADCESLYGADASLLCLRRQIGSPREEPHRSLGYWPRLGEVAPHQVANYLVWHAEGRQRPDIDLGYVFLYFYGLERRSLLDGQDIIPIAQEISRLLGIYGGSRSFRRYASNLISHLVMVGKLKPTTKLITKLLHFQGEYVEQELSTLLLGYLARQQQPMPADWAIILAAQDERARRSVVQERAGDELNRLFTLKYQERFGKGLVPITGSTESVLPYRAASPSLMPGTREAAEIPIAKWPSVQGWRRQFAPVVELWNDCLEELRGFARKAETSGRGSAYAYEALPPALRKEATHPLQSAWDTLLAEFSPEVGVILLPVSKLAELRGLEQRSKLTVKQSRDLAELADMLGTPLEPDSRYTDRAYSWDSHVAALKLPEMPTLPAGPNYLLAGVILRLALEVARADGTVDEDERRVMTEFLGERFMLTWNDRLRLNGLLQVLLKDDVSLSGLKKLLLDKFNEDQRSAIGRYLVNIATSAKGVVPEEVRALERTYKSLGLDPGLVARHLGDIGHPRPERPVLVAPGQEDTRGEGIPAEGVLDLDRIRKLRAESDEVAKMLLDAMSQTKLGEEPEELGEGAREVRVESSLPALVQIAPVIESVRASGSERLLSELAEGTRQLVQDLITKDTWTRADLEQLVRKHGRTVAAALEEINGWADERLGDFLVDGDDPARINRDLLNKAGNLS